MCNHAEQKENPQFASKEEAIEWMEREIDDPCMDNYRFAFKDDEGAMNEYELRAIDGCCGSADYDVLVDGRLATIGCNYGH